MAAEGGVSLERFSQALDIGRDALAQVADCVRFFSRLPVPDRLTPLSPNLPQSIASLPLAGLVIALPAALVLVLFGLSKLPVLAVAALAIVALGLTTGFLHEDGLSDTADGLLGSQSRERRLEIMRDSRIGAFGAVALTLSLILRVGLLAAILDRFGVGSGFLVVLVTAAVSRGGLVLFWVGLPPARTEGLSATIGQPEARSVLIALILCAVLGLLLAILVSGFGQVILGFGLVGAVLIALSIFADQRIGGQTGDVLGAMQQLGEIAFLMGLLM